MQAQSQDAIGAGAAIRAAYPDSGQQQVYFTVRQFPSVEPAWTEGALRNLIFKAQPRQSSKGEIHGNGLLEAGAIVRRGRKVLIHRQRFLAWMEGAR